ncbi:MAG: transcription elongation factor GreA [Parcubacteria group bacterium]|nr:transcription elongation factor GreA [Parcubacteria group bacterium]MCR4342366.1 transcription elongation factor GreA [Patescibacteria group bacterium]
MTTYLTLEGLEKMKKELEHLKTVKRKEIAEELETAISFGDLKENASYQSAKDAQGLMEERIMEIEDAIRNSVVAKKNKSDKIQIGSKVKAKIDNSEKTFHIVSPSESDPLEGKISYQSPIGRALMEKLLGEKIKIETPGGIKDCEILSIE